MTLDVQELPQEFLPKPFTLRRALGAVLFAISVQLVIGIAVALGWA